VTETTEPIIDELGFDEALAELQRVVAELEAGGQPLERALALHERGAALIERCNGLLSAAELRMQQLVAQSSGLKTVDVRADESPSEA
jgi:exodeoxyribonuclease VII small subunit